jgi:F0F1-type ATP synthase assembly protein I
MIKVLALILTIAGIIGLVLGILGIFGRNVVALSPWALAILGIIFFSSGIALLKRRRDTDEV